MIWLLLQQVGFWAFVFFSAYFVIKKQYEKLLALYFWSLAFNCCFTFAVTIWLPSKIVAIAMCYCVFFQQPIRNEDNRISSLKKFLFATLIISDIVCMVTDKPFNTTVANPYSRLLMGNIQYLIAIISISFYRFLSVGFTKRLYPEYCFAVEIAIFSGMVHYICNRVGISFMPILRVADSNSSDSVVAEFGGQLIQRIYGFCGEPKNLGFFVVPYVVSSMVLFFKEQYRFSKIYHLFCLLLGFFVVYQTYSSAALIELIIAVPIALFITKARVKGTTILTICLIGISFLVLSNTDSGISNISDSIYERTFERSASEMEEGRQETYLLEAYSETSPINQLFGWGPYQYTFQAEGQLYSTGGFQALQSGFVLALSDFGIMGIIALLACLIMILKTNRFATTFNNCLPLCYTIIAICVFVGNMMYGSISGVLIYLIICMASVEDEKLLNT